MNIEIYTLVKVSGLECWIEFKGQLNDVQILKTLKTIIPGEIAILDAFNAFGGEVTTARIGTRIREGKITWTIEETFKNEAI